MMAMMVFLISYFFLCDATAAAFFHLRGMKMMRYCDDDGDVVWKGKLE
jgi:hypothetical protein